jgi:putative endonuclease
MSDKPWSVYIIKCRDGKLYTGISNDVERRVKEHDTGKGCRFTKYRYPVKLVYKEESGTQSAARMRELEIQGFKRKKKLELIDNISNV